MANFYNLSHSKLNKTKMLKSQNLQFAWHQRIIDFSENQEEN